MIQNNTMQLGDAIHSIRNPRFSMEWPMSGNTAYYPENNYISWSESFTNVGNARAMQTHLLAIDVDLTIEEVIATITLHEITHQLIYQYLGYL